MLVAVLVLYSILGWSTFTSLGVFLFFTLLGLPLGRIQLRLRRKTLHAKDVRINIVTEILETIRLLKNFAWEEPWLKKAQQARRRELKLRLQSNIVDASLNLLVILTLPSMIFIAFVCYSKVAKQPLSVNITFPGWYSSTFLRHFDMFDWFGISDFGLQHASTTSDCYATLYHIRAEYSNISQAARQILSRTRICRLCLV